MELIQNLFSSLRSALTLETQSDIDESYLSDAIDHADLERRIASQSRAHPFLAPLNIGR
jgi:hypothetical protein